MLLTFHQISKRNFVAYKSINRTPTQQCRDAAAKLPTQHWEYFIQYFKKLCLHDTALTKKHIINYPKLNH